METKTEGSATPTARELLAKKARSSWAVRKVAKDLQVSGIWAPIPLDGIGTIQMRIRARDTVAYQEVVQRIYKPVRARYGDQPIPAELQHALTLEILAEGIVTDWKEVPDNSGNPFPYNKENVILFLDNFPDARDAVAAVSGQYALFLAQAEKDVLGN